MAEIPALGALTTSDVPSPSVVPVIVDTTVTAKVAKDAAVSTMLDSLRLVSYYPADGGWSAMWTNWDPAKVTADFAKLQSVGFNAVRIIVLTSPFGFPQPQPLMLSHLADAVAIAANHGLRVQLTLFDGYSDWSNIAGSKTWLQAVVSPYANDPRIAFVELRNEVDPTNPSALDWSSQLLAYEHVLAPSLPTTISSSGTGGIPALSQLKDALGSRLDFLDFHYYGKAARATTVFSQAKALAAGAPLFIGETGFSTDPQNTSVAGLPSDQGALEAYQDLYFRTVALAARHAGLAPPGLWVFSDFAPTAIPGGDPSSEYHFGLFRTDGSAKPVTSSIRDVYDGTGVSCSYNGGFENGGGSALPSDWQLSSRNLATFARDTSTSHSGTASARITASSGNSVTQPAFLVTPPGTLIPGSRYHLGAWIRGANATGTNRIAISWIDADENWIGSTESPPLAAGTSGWSPASVEATAPPNAAYAEIRLESIGNQGSVWFDDVTFGSVLASGAVDLDCS